MIERDRSQFDDRLDDAEALLRAFLECMDTINYDRRIGRLIALERCVEEFFRPGNGSGPGTTSPGPLVIADETDRA